METQSINSESNPQSDKWVSIHYVIVKKRIENDIKDNPNDFDEHSLNALSLYFNKDLKGSVEAFDNAIRINPAKAEYYYYRNLVKYAQDDYPGALKDCNKAIKKRFGYKKAIVRRGVTEYQCGLFTKALEDLNGIISIDPLCGEAFFFRGIIKTTTGYKKEGMVDLLKGQNLGYRDGCVIYDGEWE
jgi:tetratricopeptide (TPR) repeat protein